MFAGCESSDVKKNREVYMQFLSEMSDQKGYLKINSERISKSERGMFFLVDFETRYCGEQFKDVAEFHFVTNRLVFIDEEIPKVFKMNHLQKVIQCTYCDKKNRLKAIENLTVLCSDSPNVIEALSEVRRGSVN